MAPSFDVTSALMSSGVLWHLALMSSGHLWHLALSVIWCLWHLALISSGVDVTQH